ncbi:hypothetical protein ACFV0Y_16670 [Streptomyces sp. NPDC059569]|uniref:hypothetical protein n=1 Tax=Streptomyces sp. NPDC059569 TaxID=3346869 RepID=UPI0036B24ABF
MDSIIAVVGTLLGVTVAGLFQHQAAARTERAARAAELRIQRLDALTELASRISAHRIAMYKRGDARLRDASEELIEQLRSESHATRAAVAQPLARVRILIQDHNLRAAAAAMVDATFGMRRADGTTDAELTREGLTAARAAAVEAHDRFVDIAADYLTTAN